MLPSQHRLNKRQDIERVFKRGRTFYANNLGLRFGPMDLAKSRFTVVVSLKVSKKAVARNLLKRRLREIIRRDVLPRLRQNVDGLILTKQPLLKLPFTELKQLTLELFKKARLI
ncbi:MAG: ribonuclease P protein component [Candidatus Komeilibacteria bacterium]|nr:ribonuclease P protein component [Candidatus Komeilibacteria bacterium]